AEVASITRRHDLREGIAEFKGNGSWSLDQFATSGVLALRDFGWQDDQVSLEKASASADYSVTDQQFKLSKLQRKLLRGSFTGDAQVDNWLHSIPQKDDIAIITAARPKTPLKKGQVPKSPSIQTGVVHVRLRDVSAEDLASAVNTRAHPLGNFRPS